MQPIIDLQQQLFKAMDTGKLQFAYQPIICAHTYMITQYECLLRITTDDGVLSAGLFIEATEKLGGILHIDTFVLEHVLIELQTHPAIHLAVNVSNISIASKAWLTKAQQVLTDSAVTNRLIIEITETGRGCDLAQITCGIQILKETGCRVALDDFGAGIFSADNIYLEQLPQLEIDIIKIDGTYIKNALHNHNYRGFIQQVTSFARHHDIKTVAEFVENAETVALMRQDGVDYMQGHYFSPALNHKPWTLLPTQ